MSTRHDHHPRDPRSEDLPDVQERIRAARNVAAEMLQERRQQVQRDLEQRTRELAEEQPRAS